MTLGIEEVKLELVSNSHPLKWLARTPRGSFWGRGREMWSCSRLGHWLGIFGSLDFFSLFLAWLDILMTVGEEDLGLPWRRCCCLKASRTFPGSEGNQEVSTRSWVSLATLQEDGVVCPQHLTGTSLPTLWGVWGLDDRPGCGQGMDLVGGKLHQLWKTSDSNWPTVNQIRRSLLFLFVFLLFLFSGLLHLWRGCLHKWP